MGGYGLDYLWTTVVEAWLKISAKYVSNIGTRLKANMWKGYYENIGVYLQFIGKISTASTRNWNISHISHICSIYRPYELTFQIYGDTVLKKKNWMFTG